MSGNLLCCRCIALSYNSRLPIRRNFGLHRFAGGAALHETGVDHRNVRNSPVSHQLHAGWALRGARCRNSGRQKPVCRPETNDAIVLYIGFLLIKRRPSVGSARLIWFTIKMLNNGGQCFIAHHNRFDAIEAEGSGGRKSE